MKGKYIRSVALPWSDGMLSARLWNVGRKMVVGVPELGLHCYGSSQAEAVLRLFTILLKYYRQLKTFEYRLGERGLVHLQLLSKWVETIENKLTTSSSQTKVALIGASHSDKFF